MTKEKQNNSQAEKFLQELTRKNLEKRFTSEKKWEVITSNRKSKKQNNRRSFLYV